MDTELCCCMATDPYIALRGSKGWHFTKVSGARVGYSHWTIPLYPRIFSSASLLNTQTVPLLFLSRLSSTYLHIIADLVVGRPLGVFHLPVCVYF